MIDVVAFLLGMIQGMWSGFCGAIGAYFAINHFIKKIENKKAKK